MKTVDARGLSCPQPVLATLEAIKEENKGEIEILVDTDTSKENVIRAAERQGCAVIAICPDNGGYSITIKKA